MRPGGDLRRGAGPGGGARLPPGPVPQPLRPRRAGAVRPGGRGVSGPPRRVRRGRPGPGGLRPAGHPLHRLGPSGLRHGHEQGCRQAGDGARGYSHCPLAGADLHRAGHSPPRRGAAPALRGEDHQRRLLPGHGPAGDP